MTSSRDGISDHHTFSRRYGYEPLPRPMQLEEISEDLRREVFNAVRVLLLGTKNSFGYFVNDGARFIERIFGKFSGIAEDKVDNNYKKILGWANRTISYEEFNRVLDFLEIVMNDDYDTEYFSTHIGELFEQHGAVYRLNTSQRPYRFFPCSSKEQGDATHTAIETLRGDNMHGASTHLRQAAEHINARRYGSSIADSIHAVESVARHIDPKSSKALGPTLRSIEDAGLLKHPALKQAFSKLYGYTSDEQGIRHALIDQAAADVGLDEAMFMFGACASFAAYLSNKHRQAVGRGPNRP